MKNVLAALAATVAVLAGSAQAQQQANPRVELKTNRGVILIELFQDKAPKSAANFLQYVRDGHYKGTVFHRVIPGFMVQGGGFDAKMAQKSTRAPIENEATNGLKNDRGTLAMARTPDPHSASAQFFINVADNAFLNHTGPTPRGWGYAVFGRVVQGMDVVDKIVASPTGTAGMHENVPREPIVIESATVLANAK